MSSILVIDDKDSLRKMLTQALSTEGYQVESAKDGRSGLELARRKSYDLVLTDLKMPDISGIEVLKNVKEMDVDTSVIVMTAYGTITDAVEAMRKGAYDFITKPFEIDHLTLLVKKALENKRLQAENSLLREELALNLGFSDIIGSNEKMKEVSRLVSKVANSDTSVLITGESGVGKELFARAVHSLSPRRDKAYVTINCAAIPSELLENELFGSERGAFTGAVARKIGKFEIADGGTIFLDEIGDMELALQAKLLRVLQNKTIERLGGSKPIKIDVRVVAASNLNLMEAIEKKRFREDLFYRLAVFPIHVPPLRERSDDIRPLAEFFLDKFCKEMKRAAKTFSKDALSLLEKYHWPGNVRELENTIERAVILADGKKITTDHLAIRVTRPEDIQLRDGTGLKDIAAHAQMVAERGTIIRVLNQVRGNKRKCAKILKIDYTTLFDKIKKYDITSDQVSY
ncbi:MAG: sigma-54-dependent Fis family transcriptional regulator [candidate division Zixibacteria bacterium]|nr:sigma-54-dependent Fis family transcriptional regulator [candidate division Zixibacteria bacterium]